MKPYNLLNRTVCDNCGKVGWNPESCGGWNGVFVCSKGCNPNDVTDYQRALVKEEVRKELIREGVIKQN